MRIPNENNGVVIGAIFSACSIAMSATFIAPVISILPGVLFESFAKECINNEPYSNVGKLTILMLSIAFILSLTSCLISTRVKINSGKAITQKRVITMLSIMYLTVHSLGFYIYWGVFLNFVSDGQLVFAAILTCPFSGIMFIIIGFLIDLIKNKNIKLTFRGFYVLLRIFK